MGMTLRGYRRGCVLNLLLYAVMLMFLAGIIYFSYLMVMRAQWRSLKNDIADAINDSRYASPKMYCGGNELPFTQRDELYFSKFITDPYFIPIKAGEMEIGERSLVISLGESSLSFAPGGEDGVIYVRLDSPSGSKGFYVRSPVDFAHLERYFDARYKYPD